MRAKKRAQPEKAFMNKVVRAASMLGWSPYHTHDSRRSHPGWPDLVLIEPIKQRRVLFAEIKAEKGKVTAEQDWWLRALRACGEEAYLWRPSDWDAIIECLRARPENKLGPAPD